MKATRNPPPASNTGVENPTVSSSLDWIEGTFPNGITPVFPLNLAKEYNECKPFHGYTEGTKFIDGRVMLTNASRPDMGTHIIWSGGSLQDIPMPASGLVHFLSRHGFRFTRLDFAVDMRNWGIKPRHATRYIRRKQFICRAKKYPVNYDPVYGGYTQYCGTKASEVFLRIYDKAAQMEVSGDWTRAELVASGRRANVASAALIRGEDFRGLVGGFIRFPKWDKWNEAMGANVVSLPAEKKLSATEKWLLTQCAPALGTLLAKHPDNTFLNLFLEVALAQREAIADKYASQNKSVDTA